ncbi:MAG: MCE family protein, partial [Bdellovibrionales bacterium]|nr:MCE family protein [Bdellovibrionales bacterium]
GKGDREQPIAKIVDNLERVTKQLADMTEDNREGLESIVDDIRSVAANLRKTTQKENMEKIERTLANIEEITDKVNQGEGTIGKLVNDEKTVTGINTAIDGVNRYLDVANRIQTSVALRTEYLGQSALNRTYLGVRITPGLDRYYDIAVVDDPMGVMERVDTSTFTGGTMTHSSETKVWKNKVKFTALLAKNFYDFTIRGGIIESSGGLAMDYHMFRKRLSFSLEAFDFQPSNVRWRAQVKVVPYHGFTIVAGGDDWNSASRPFSSYLGAGLEFTNDDLKMVLAR